ncbi:MAG TPA: hypothetical protein DCZ13_05720 [Porticoccaceae bacterium]|nr:hypothetical protein [Porticoccaceae bacterium]
MNSEQINSLLAQIEVRIAELESNLFPANSRSDDNSESLDADEKLSEAVNTHIRDKSRRELARLRANLDWLGGDDAGLCESCHEVIPYERLCAVPVTRLCVYCAE